MRELWDPSGLLVGGVLDITVFFCLSKQSKLSLRGMQANAGMINTAVGCGDTYCKPGHIESVEDLRETGESGCFEGTKQNIMRETKGEKKKMPGSLLLRNWGQVFPTSTYKTYSCILTSHSVGYSWFLFAAFKVKQHPVADVKKLKVYT